MSPKRPEVYRSGTRGNLIRVVSTTNHGMKCYLVMYRNAEGVKQARIFPRPSGKAEALAFAGGIAETKRAPKGTPPRPITLEGLWTAYSADVFPALRPRSRILYWAEMHEKIPRSRIALYVYRVAKEQRPVSPDEYRAEDLTAILAVFDPAKSTEWRPWVALTLCGNQGSRQHAVLHLRWEDVDFAAGTITWQSQWDKTGTTRIQPLWSASRAALELAKERTGGRGWVLPGFGRGEHEAPYTIQALWAALKRAEERAGIPHKSRRGGHGFRRLLAGEVNELTGNAKLAMDTIGDRDPRQMDRYIKVREDQIRAAFEALDASDASQVQAEPPQ